MTAHILIVADGRSPTAQSWIRNVQSLGYSVSLISTFPCSAPPGLKQFHVLPIAFSRFSTGHNPTARQNASSKLKDLVHYFTPLLQKLRYLLGPITLPAYSRTYQGWVAEIKPDLVHALRIPFEGMLASYTPEGIPCLAATWGNDLTLHASGSPLMRMFTRRCLERADGLTSDTHRDVRLAHDWGLNPAVPTLVVPGSGGLDLAEIQGVQKFQASQFGIPKTGYWVVNSRGLRPRSVHQDVFFRAISKILANHPDTIFICPGLQGKKQAHDWVESLGIREHTFLLPQLTQFQLWSLFNESAVYVSPSSHDGTPNSLLEAMAYGCFPVVGDIESLREWVEHNVNGLLVNPRNPEALAGAILKALDEPELRLKAAASNKDEIKNRALKSATLPKIDCFYQQFLN